MIAYYCAFVVLLYVYAIECRKYRYDYTFDSDVYGWFKLHRVPATWHDAWLRCQLEGAVLASPEDKSMDLAMRNVMRNKNLLWDGVHTGVHATFSKGDFFSVGGVPLTRMPVKWMPLEPNNKYNTEDCILMVDNGSIADISCDEVHPYMCFRKKTKGTLLNECGTFDQEYNLDARTGSCYKFHRVTRNWTRAFMTCAAEGAHLAVVNSDIEANVLKELFEKNPPNTIIGAIPGIMRDIMHIGFNDWGERGVWTTIHGTSLVEAGFNSWSENQPDDAFPGEYCGGMFRNGRLDDVWCHERGPFVCEKTPQSLIEEEDPLDEAV